MQGKTYLSILNSFYNDKKIPIIPPLLIDDKFVTDIQKKANISNIYFADQCTTLKNCSALPTSLMFLTPSRLCTLNFSEMKMIKVIMNNYDISIRLIKICGKSILKPLILLFENSTKSSYHPDIWKRSNVIPVHKKNDRRFVNNYRPIFLLPIFGKI